MLMVTSPNSKLSRVWWAPRLGSDTYQRLALFVALACGAAAASAAAGFGAGGIAWVSPDATRA